MENMGLNVLNPGWIDPMLEVICMPSSPRLKLMFHEKVLENLLIYTRALKGASESEGQL
jgi:hypothetical protein